MNALSIESDAAPWTLKDDFFTGLQAINGSNAFETLTCRNAMLPLDRVLAMTANFDTVVGGCGLVSVIANAIPPVAPNEDLIVMTDVKNAILAYGVSLIIADRNMLVVTNLFLTVISNKKTIVVFDMNVFVLFGMDVHLFLPQLILKTQLVETFALMGPALDEFRGRCGRWRWAGQDHHLGS